jgi:hypothetical protein
MRQYLMQPRRCGAADLRAWRTDRKRQRPFEFADSTSGKLKDKVDASVQRVKDGSFML